MKNNKWNQYFASHYRPLGNEWGQKDVERYAQWYFSWINYIEKKCSVLRKKAQIFEIGSAVGAEAKLLHDRGHDVTGSDISDLMVKTANKLCASVRFVYCDIQKGIPVRKKFDAVMGFEVLEHVPNLKKALTNIERSLHKGGYFIGTSPYPYAKNYLDRTHVNVKYPGQWRKLFLDNGFSSVRMLPMSFLPLVWRLSKYTNPVLPFYISWPFFVSTTLIIAKK